MLSSNPKTYAHGPETTERKGRNGCPGFQESPSEERQPDPSLWGCVVFSGFEGLWVTSLAQRIREREEARIQWHSPTLEGSGGGREPLPFVRTWVAAEL